MDAEKRAGEKTEERFEIEVECPVCGTLFTAVCDEACQASPQATCPKCGERIGLPPLVEKT